jgi:hypothetical protein
MLSANEYKVLLRKYIARFGVPEDWHLVDWQREELRALKREYDAISAG